MFEGSIVAIVTPMREGEIDEASFRKLVRMHRASGTSGIVPAGCTGEAATLTLDERMRLIEVCLEEVGDAIRSLLPKDVLVLTKADFVAREVAYWSRAQPIGYVFAFGAIMGFVVGAIIVYQILFADVSEHLSEYATLRAMGYSNGFVSSVVSSRADGDS